MTVGFCEIMRLVELNWMAVTNGPLGIKAIPKPMFFGLKIKTPLAFYYYILILLILVTFILSRILKSRFGRAIVAVREDEIAASAMGVNVFLVKIVAFAISAMVAGLVGTFYAQYIVYRFECLYNCGFNGDIGYGHFRRTWKYGWSIYRSGYFDVITRTNEKLV